jgi:hypothetical protein
MAVTAPLIYEFNIDPAETVRASRVVQRRQRFAWIAWAVWPILIALAVWYLATGVPWQKLWLLGLVALFLLTLQLLTPWIQRWQLRRAYAETPILRGPQVYQFSDAGLSITGEAATTTLGWDSFVEAAETDEFFLFFYSKQCAYYVPKRAVGKAIYQRALRALLRAKLGRRAAGLWPAEVLPRGSV